MTREEADAIIDAADMAAAAEIAMAADAAASAATATELAASEAEAIALAHEQADRAPGGWGRGAEQVDARYADVSYAGAISAARGDPAEAARILEEARAANAASDAAAPAGEPSEALRRARWYSAQAETLAALDGATREGEGGPTAAAAATAASSSSVDTVADFTRLLGGARAGAATAGSGSPATVAVESLTEEEEARAAVEAVAAAEVVEAEVEAEAEAVAQATARAAAARAGGGAARRGGSAEGSRATAATPVNRSAASSVVFIPMPRPALDVAVVMREQPRQPISAAATRPNIRGLGTQLNGSATIGGRTAVRTTNGGSATRIMAAPRSARTGGGGVRQGERSVVVHGPTSAAAAASAATSTRSAANGVTVPAVGGGGGAAGRDGAWPWSSRASADEGGAGYGPVMRSEDGDGDVESVTLRFVIVGCMHGVVF